MPPRHVERAAEAHGLFHCGNTQETRPNLVKVPLSMASGRLSAPVLPAAVARDGLGMAQSRARFLKADTSDTLKPVRDVP